MRIIVQEIEPAGEPPAQNTRRTVRFSSSLASGVAYLVSRLDRSVTGPCELFVEVSQDSISDIHVSAERSVGQMVYLGDPGVFHVSGTVTTVVSLDDSQQDVVSLRAGDATLELSAENIADMKLAVGDTLTFVARGMTLWDENL